MRVLLHAAIAILSTAAIASCETSSATVTAPPAGARYEVVQSTILARYTFKLDRFTGNVWQYTCGPDAQSECFWSRMHVDRLPAVSKGTAARFQIFLSGLLARNSYLIDTVSGSTWLLVVDKDGDNSWEKLKVGSPQ